MKQSCERHSLIILVITLEPGLLPNMFKAACCQQTVSDYVDVKNCTQKQTSYIFISTICDRETGRRVGFRVESTRMTFFCRRRGSLSTRLKVLVASLDPLDKSLRCQKPQKCRVSLPKASVCFAPDDGHKISFY